MTKMTLESNGERTIFLKIDIRLIENYVGTKKLNPYLITSTKFNSRFKCDRNNNKVSRTALFNRTSCDDGNVLCQHCPTWYP